ncbi:Glu/Leu/Phe/Val family dehydrogenase [Criblamydia sequanensis]|uniref:Glutamate dehydrogenase/leucine dehydrogenase n=1 Tax=Candidatus Criblamydia sequanensis CRIB-18 TaxID=1437425 RepID=A0A090D2Z7_9BACT|nr:Glu/Leu/Phe/Val dehydrogenase dimerization domain-containing protein [Criblamydia sequanensis]CDR34773.1 Glutamate dehydrogenase/leucine dehydrogenase [Criblamydia sequanensis CRIB-18]
MIKKKILDIPGYEKVIEAMDEDSKLHCIIAVHNTSLGPALGGVRIYPYQTFDDALKDVLLLAKAMTNKSALAEIGLGGGKSVIIADPKVDKSENLLKKFGEVINDFKGSYIVAEDVGSSPEDMLHIRKTTPYVSALPTSKSSGDPSPFTAWGVFRGIQAVLKELYGSTEVKNRRIAIQGLGHVGHFLAEHLFWQGADLVVTDIDSEKCATIKRKFGAEVIAPDRFIHEKCDILAPCALGGVFNQENAKTLKCKAIAGSANNQLADSQTAEVLHQHEILYAPDFLINSGGLINAVMEFEKEGYDPKHSCARVSEIFNSLQLVFAMSKKENKSTESVAEDLAAKKLKNKYKMRKEPISFKR